MKRIIYTLACLMLSVGAWAQGTLQEQINNAVAGTTVTLSEDVTLTSRIDISKNITVDLGNHTITTTATCGNGSAFNIVSGTVTIQNGTINASFGEANSGETDAITARSGSDVTLKDLNITVKSKNGACAYAFEGSKITIKSGHYENQTTEVYEWNSNIKAMVVNQANVATQLIFIEGGTFKGYDPTLGDDSQIKAGNENATFLADGFALKKNAYGNYETTTAVAKIGGRNYASIKDAVIAATAGQTVTLLDNTTENIVVPADKEITLDLNGKTLSGGSVASNGKNAAIVNNGTIIIQDSSAEQTGTIKREDDDTSLSASNSYYVIDNQGTMTIKSGNVMNKAGVPGAHKGSSLIRNGEPNSAVLTIEGGTLTQDKFDVIKNGGNGTLNITGGTINSANSYAVLSYSLMNMSEGSINGKVCLRSYTDSEEDTHGVGNITGGTINGDITVETYKGNTPNSLSECNISGTAVINGTLSIGEGNGNIFTANDEKGTIAVSGGTFNNAVQEQYCAVGYIPTDDGNGNYTVKEGAYIARISEQAYETLAEAVAAAQNDETITLLANTIENVTIPAGKNITLDLNGMTLSGGTVASNGKKAAIVNYGTLTIQDSSEEKTGTVKREDDDTELSASNSYYVIDNQGVMTIKSGSITNKAGVPGAHKGSSLIRNGEIEEGAVLNIEGGTLTQANFDVIKNGGKNSVLYIMGGTINSANSYAVLSYDVVNMTGGEVNGKVCFRSYSDSDGDSYGVGNITGGTINGDITVETYPGNTPNTLSKCNISDAAVINGTLSIGVGNGTTFEPNDVNGTIAVSGGTFNNPVPEKYCADGYIPEDNGNGTYGVKSGSYVAQIGDIKYESLSEAVAAATDGEASTITLLTDVIENITIPAGKNITLDLNSNTLNGKKVANTPTIKNQGTLTLKNGNVRREGEGSASWYVIENEGSVTMDEGLNVVGSASSSLIRNNAATASMTFNAGTYTQTGAFIVVKNDLGNVVINDGTFSTASDKNVLNNWDQMTINGGTFTGNLFNGAYDTDNNKLTVNDGTFNTSQIRTYLGNGKTLCPIEINGGTFADAQMKYVGTDNKESDTDVQVAVSGGTFANPVPEKYCASGFIPKDNADGTYGVKEGSYIARIDEQGYETLDEAIEAAKQTETATTINLLDNAETTKEVLPENVTINANSKVLTMPSFVVLDGQAYTLPNITGAVTYKVKKATYIRTNISATEWGTVCLPFSLTSGNGAKYYTFNNISDNTLTVDETETVVPHTPVVFNKVAGDLEINETNAIVSLVTPSELKNGALIATYTSATIPASDGNFYFINGDRFHQVQASLTVPMYRAYIDNATSGAKPRVLSIVVNEEATAIETVDADANAEIIAIYDASGRKLQSPQKGLNIMKLENGKTLKVVIK